MGIYILFQKQKEKKKAMCKQNQEARHCEVLPTSPHILSVTEWLENKNRRYVDKSIFYIGCDLMFEFKQGVFNHISFHKAFNRRMEMEDTCLTIIK